MGEYQIIISYGDECHIAPIVDKAAFDAVVDAVKRRGYEISKGEPEKAVYAAYREYYAMKDGKQCFTIGCERVE